MKVLLLNGSPHERGCTMRALLEVSSTLERHGIMCDTAWIGTKPVAGCIACGTCREKGVCIYNDEVNPLAERIETYDGIVIGTPVYYADMTGQLASFLDRLFYMCGSRMAGKVAAAVVSCRRGGASSAFDSVNKYFLMNNMYVVGAQYWNQVHGTCKEEVERDEEGLQTMRTLGENMAYLLRAMDVARQQGVPKPKYEEKIRTNFIR